MSPTKEQVDAARKAVKAAQNRRQALRDQHAAERDKLRQTQGDEIAEAARAEVDALIEPQATARQALRDKQGKALTALRQKYADVCAKPHDEARIGMAERHSTELEAATADVTKAMATLRKLAAAAALAGDEIVPDNQDTPDNK